MFGPFILSDVLKLCKASNKPPGRHQIQNAEGPVLDPLRLKRVLNGASNKPPGRHQIQNAEGPVLDKQMYFRMDPKVDPLRIEVASGPSWRACVWPLHFVRCAEALQAAMCAKCQA